MYVDSPLEIVMLEKVFGRGVDSSTVVIWGVVFSPQTEIETHFTEKEIIFI